MTLDSIHHILGDATMSHAEIAAKLLESGDGNFSRSEIRYIETVALTKLKKRLSSRFGINVLDDICD